MQKESNYLFGVTLFSGSLLASGLYLASFHFFSSAAQLFFTATVLLAFLGIVKILNHFAPSLPLPLNRVVHWIHSVVFETFSIAASFLFRFVGFISGKEKACGPNGGRPILLVHGYLYNASVWRFLKRELCNRGLGPVYTISLGHPFLSIRDYARLVAEKAALISEETKREDLTLIGHSMGGLVSAWYASKVAPAGKVADVITIGSPLAGTHVAAIALGPNGKEMRRGSDFVRELQEEIGKNEKIRFYHIASRSDQIVVPYTSALSGRYPEREYVVDDIGHMTLLFSPRVADQIEVWLSRASAD